MRRGPVFDALLRANVPAEEKTLQRLEDESFTLFSAGSETVSQALSVIFFHLLKNAEFIKTLRKELKQVMPMPTDLATWSELEKLPFLVRNMLQLWKVCRILMSSLFFSHRPLLLLKHFASRELQVDCLEYLRRSR